MSSGDLIGDTRLLLGLLIAPALIPIYRAIVPYYDFYSVRGEALIEPVAIAAGVAYVGAAILGLPYTFSLRGIGWLNYGTVMAPTLILVALVLLLEQMTPHGIGNVYGGVMSIAPGVLWAGICFHLLTIWRYEPGAKWPLLLSIAFIWLLHIVCVAIQRHNCLTSNPISDTGAALGLMIVMRGGRILSLAGTIVPACVWLVCCFLNRKAPADNGFFRPAGHDKPRSCQNQP